MKAVLSGTAFLFLRMKLEALHREFLDSKGISTDTRQEVSDTLFFALKGERFDGNRYVAEAQEKGCLLAITDDAALRGSRGTLYTPSALGLLQSLAAFHRNYANPRVLAITGSNGKTTTKELVAAILSTKHSVLATRGNLNNHIGVPLTLLSLRKEQIAVVEMGANHPGEIRALCGMARPEAGLITNVGLAHLEGFGSLEGVLEAKGELFEFLAGEQGSALVDGEDRSLLEKAHSTGVDTLVIGPGGELPVSAKILHHAPCLEVEMELAGRVHRVKTSLVGAYNLQNIRLAAAVGLYFGVPAGAIAGAIAGYRPENQRSQLIRGTRNILMEDSYNANPTSMREAISGLLDFADPPVMLILGDMAELGTAGLTAHRELLEWIRERKVEQVLAAGPLFSQACEASEACMVFKSVEELEAHLKAHPPEGFSILLKGSRVMAMERLVPLLTE
jgi:UDP-N-acetylmuramoyl-tripeptide--D-alanyl-D-alanine ligase